MNATETLKKLLFDYSVTSFRKSHLHYLLYDSLDDSLFLMDSSNQKGVILDIIYRKGIMLTEFCFGTKSIPFDNIKNGDYSFSDKEKGKIALKRIKILHKLTLKLDSLANDLNLPRLKPQDSLIRKQDISTNEFAMCWFLIGTVNRPLHTSTNEYLCLLLDETSQFLQENKVKAFATFSNEKG